MDNTTHLNAMPDDILAEAARVCLEMNQHDVNGTLLQQYYIAKALLNERGRAVDDFLQQVAVVEQKRVARENERRMKRAEPK